MSTFKIYFPYYYILKTGIEIVTSDFNMILVLVLVEVVFDLFHCQINSCVQINEANYRNETYNNIIVTIFTNVIIRGLTYLSMMDIRNKLCYREQLSLQFNLKVLPVAKPQSQV